MVGKSTVIAVAIGAFALFAIAAGAFMATSDADPAEACRYLARGCAEEQNEGPSGPICEATFGGCCEVAPVGLYGCEEPPVCETSEDECCVATDDIQDPCEEPPVCDVGFDECCVLLGGVNTAVDECPPVLCEQTLDACCDRGGAGGASIAGECCEMQLGSTSIAVEGCGCGIGTGVAFFGCEPPRGDDRCELRTSRRFLQIRYSECLPL